MVRPVFGSLMDAPSVVPIAMEKLEALFPASQDGITRQTLVVSNLMLLFVILNCEQLILELNVGLRMIIISIVLGGLQEALQYWILVEWLAELKLKEDLGLSIKQHQMPSKVVSFVVQFFRPLSKR